MNDGEEGNVMPIDRQLPLPAIFLLNEIRDLPQSQRRGSPQAFYDLGTVCAKNSGLVFTRDDAPVLQDGRPGQARLEEQDLRVLRVRGLAESPVEIRPYSKLFILYRTVAK
jgi:hypothetical protein